ncbi:hypothetical protein MM326_13935 [Alkalihalobacillus sp. LMS6]|jgi:hypothetical protein|uniref:hypothetical protein n=1 Tax=Alkalihalobacillus sp. LMS6 TaxID=2924034 RepID=UPI0020D13469|nr:hypothetical protein [Alkalihalobacillus sp. LMS6]UTR05203.1 hypothetical protein MM326_13935 [Alkalihalobacillus sp. LMS6]
MKRLKDEELTAIRERCEKATAGPWDICDGTSVYEVGEKVFFAEVCETVRPPDANFVSHVREDVPRLLAEIEDLKSKVLVLRAHISANGAEARHTEKVVRALTEKLREIDAHVRSTPDPVPHIIKTLKSALPEYRGKEDA